MARATSIIGKVPEPVPAPVGTKIVLELSPHEVAALMLVIRCVGGSGPRAHIDSIGNALNCLHHNWKYSQDYGITGSLSFLNYTPDYDSLVDKIARDGITK